jgi:hypothetical protein
MDCIQLLNKIEPDLVIPSQGSDNMDQSGPNEYWASIKPSFTCSLANTPDAPEVPEASEVTPSQSQEPDIKCTFDEFSKAWKKSRKRYQKLLRDIDAFEKKKDAGEYLDREQEMKIRRRHSLEMSVCILTDAINKKTCYFPTTNASEDTPGRELEDLDPDELYFRAWLLAIGRRGVPLNDFLPWYWGRVPGSPTDDNLGYDLQTENNNVPDGSKWDVARQLRAEAPKFEPRSPPVVDGSRGYQPEGQTPSRSEGSRPSPHTASSGRGLAVVQDFIRPRDDNFQDNLRQNNTAWYLYWHPQIRKYYHYNPSLRIIRVIESPYHPHPPLSVSGQPAYLPQPGRFTEYHDPRNIWQPSWVRHSILINTPDWQHPASAIHHSPPLVQQHRSHRQSVHLSAHFEAPPAQHLDSATEQQGPLISSIPCSAAFKQSNPPPTSPADYNSLKFSTQTYRPKVKNFRRYSFHELAKPPTSSFADYNPQACCREIVENRSAPIAGSWASRRHSTYELQSFSIAHDQQFSDHHNKYVNSYPSFTSPASPARGLVSREGF